MSIPVDISTLDATILSDDPPPPYTPTSPSTLYPVIAIPQPAVTATTYPRGTTISEFLDQRDLSASSTTRPAFHSQRANVDSNSPHHSSATNLQTAQLLAQLMTPTATGPASPPSATASPHRDPFTPSPTITNQPIPSPPPRLLPDTARDPRGPGSRSNAPGYRRQAGDLGFILCCPCICAASVVLGVAEAIGKGILCVLFCPCAVCVLCADN
jgi:hypothetical protein